MRTVGYSDSYETGYGVRFQDGDDLLIGKHPVNRAEAYGVTSSGDSIAAYAWSVLQIRTECAAAWQAYDASSTEPFPERAPAGGFWADGTPLYIARMENGGQLLTGYYHPGHGLAYGERHGPRSSEVMDILTIL